MAEGRSDEIGRLRLVGALAASREQRAEWGRLGSLVTNSLAGLAKRDIKAAHELGARQRLANLEFLIWVRDVAKCSVAVKLRAVAEIEDRYGQPRQAVNLALPIDSDPPKLFDLAAGE